MAFDAQWEDYQRLSLRFARALRGEQGDNVGAYASFVRRYATDRDALPQTDADRAFHLVAESTRLIDYELPFASDEAAQTIVTHARTMLDEALMLDERCYDALRMRRAADMDGFDSYYDFLSAHEADVFAHCVEQRAEAERDVSPERAQLGSALAMLPYLRWVAALADRALVCGRNREALRHVSKVRDLDPTDAADLRFTAALAYAKLEDAQGLEQLAARSSTLRPTPDAWLRLARVSTAHKQRDYAAARAELASLASVYPHAAVALVRQQELPDGIFSRVAVAPYSEDELIVAISEATVLLQEGRDDTDLGVLGAWVLQEALALVPPEQADEVRNIGDALRARQAGDMP